MGDHGRSSGVCILMGARWLSHVLDCGTLVLGRAMWIALMVGDTRLGILNVSAPTNVRVRCGFWRAIAGVLRDMDAWINRGDFNNLEALEDQIGRSTTFDGMSLYFPFMVEMFGMRLPFRDCRVAYRSVGALDVRVGYCLIYFI